MRVLSGIQPSGSLHLGNYFGAIRQHLDYQVAGNSFYFVANYHALTAPDVSQPRLILESGINLTAPVEGPDGPRRPVISLRSTPWNAGGVINPWHDEYDLDHGHIRYFGDHKVDMRTLDSVLFLDGANVTRTSDGGVGIDTLGLSPEELAALNALNASPGAQKGRVGN